MLASAITSLNVGKLNSSTLTCPVFGSFLTSGKVAFYESQHLFRCDVNCSLESILPETQNTGFMLLYYPVHYVLAIASRNRFCSHSFPELANRFSIVKIPKQLHLRNGTRRALLRTTNASCLRLPITVLSSNLSLQNSCSN